MTLAQAEVNNTYLVMDVTGSEKIKSFLFTLGCYEDCDITLISKLGDNLIVNIKDGRYAIDQKIAKSIVLYDQLGVETPNFLNNELV